MRIFKLAPYILLTFLAACNSETANSVLENKIQNPPTELTEKGFKKWKSAYRDYALEHEIKANILDESFAKIQFNIKYAELDRKQFAPPKSLKEYYQAHINDAVLIRAKEIKKENADLLSEVANKFSVNPNYLIALWAVETKFGKYAGSNNAIEALANLAYEGRRASFFSKELLKALRMLQEGHIDFANLKSSYAGAVGQIQFMPSSYYKYAYDFDLDGKKDIWHNKQDILASAANYLSSLNWQSDLPYGYEVTITLTDEVSSLINNNKRVELASLLKHGLKRIDGKAFSRNQLREEIKIISYDSRYFMVFKNFEILKDWNRSDYFSLTVGMLAEQL